MHKYFFTNPGGALIKIVQSNHDEETDVAFGRLEHNEVEQYHNKASETAWYFNQFAMHNYSQTVYRLPVHLPQRQQ